MFSLMGKFLRTLFTDMTVFFHFVTFGIKVSSIEKLVIWVPTWEIRLRKQHFCSVLFAAPCPTNRQIYPRASL
jgi:hypothetical protein